MTPLETFWFIRDLRMPYIPKLVLFVLAGYADEDGKCFPSRKTPAEATGLGGRSVYTGLQFLSRHGLILQIYRKGASTLFKLALDDYKEMVSSPAPRADRSST